LSAELGRDIKVEPCKLTDIPRVGWKVIRIKEVK
jgi:hypothetical protein